MRHTRQHGRRSASLMSGPRTVNDHRLQRSSGQIDLQWDAWSSMKGSRFSFYFGFVVGTVTLHVFLRQVWFEESFLPSNGSSLDNLREYQQQLEEDEKVWKKERSALFNLKHPHHTGAPHLSRTVIEVLLQTLSTRVSVAHVLWWGNANILSVLFQNQWV